MRQIETPHSPPRCTAHCTQCTLWRRFVLRSLRPPNTIPRRRVWDLANRVSCLPGCRVFSNGRCTVGLRVAIFRRRFRDCRSYRRRSRSRLRLNPDNRVDEDGRILLGLPYPIGRVGRECCLAGFAHLGRTCRIQSVHVLQETRPFGKLYAKLVSERSLIFVAIFLDR